MSDLDVLRALIKEEAIVSPVNTSTGKKSATLKESGTSGNDGYSVEIKGLPKDTVIIKTDRFPPSDKIFNCRKGECRRADFVIITNSAQSNFILYIEMKKKRGKRNEIIEQLKGSQCFMAYCREIGRIFWQQLGFLDARYKNRFVIIKQVSINKRPTTVRHQSGLNDTPEKALKIGGKRNLRFRELILQ